MVNSQRLSFHKCQLVVPRTRTITSLAHAFLVIQIIVLDLNNKQEIPCKNKVLVNKPSLFQLNHHLMTAFQVLGLYLKMKVHLTPSFRHFPSSRTRFKTLKVLHLTICNQDLHEISCIDRI